MSPPADFTEAEWDTCIRVLQVLSRDPGAALDVMTLKGLVTKLSRDAKKRQRRGAAEADRARLSGTRLWRENAEANHPALPLAVPGISPATGPRARLHTPKPCYVCKALFREVHPHYHLLCPECAAENFAWRTRRADLTGRTALITGGRIKIGWQLALRFLRDGARVIVTTRFPHDAARRFSREADFPEWRHRLVIHGIDFRDIPALERLTGHLMATESALDILINNAAQTIRRPVAFYGHLRQGETEALPEDLAFLVAPGEEGKRELPVLWRDAPGWISPEVAAWMPEGFLDRDGQQVDLSAANSWTAKAGAVTLPELLEVLLISQTAPFLLACRLRPLMVRSRFPVKFIVNVSAMEGQFGRISKTTRHPHTNMAKAALNMFTRTSAADFAEDGIRMNSVDTGWITDENPFPKKTRSLEEQHFVPPLDAVDGMARIYHPILTGLARPEEEFHGHFLKDYRIHPW